MTTSVDTQIAQAEAAADAATDKAIVYTDAAQVVANGYTVPGPAITVVAPVVVPPEYNPNVLLASEFSTDFDTTWNDMEVWVRGLMTDWMNTHFPMLDPAIQTSENTWLLNVVDNGYEGIPALIERAIYDRARAREDEEAVKLSEEAVSHFSSRGFSLPAGILYDGLLTIQQNASNKISTMSRDIAIKQVELSIEMTKLAIQEMTKLRIGLADALANYMRAWMVLPTAAAEIAKAKAEMHKTLWASSADYARAQVAIAGLSLDAQKTNAGINVEMQKLDIGSANTSRELRVNAAIQAAHEMGAVASAARGAQNTIVGSVTTVASQL